MERRGHDIEQRADFVMHGYTGIQFNMETKSLGRGKETGKLNCWYAIAKKTYSEDVWRPGTEASERRGGARGSARPIMA